VAGALGQPGLVIALKPVVLRIGDAEDRAIGGHDFGEVEHSSAIGIARAPQRIRALAAMLGVLGNDSADRVKDLLHGRVLLPRGLAHSIHLLLKFSPQPAGRPRVAIDSKLPERIRVCK
jgi:hypothetical protein